ncbi:MAG: hypothetical protein K0S08_475 [Gammaproteobacteria bacterium]|jgi:hypothetical protein|nr:hypothetical protein [Gammaproteobacteria bacterium]
MQRTIFTSSPADITSLCGQLDFVAQRLDENLSRLSPLDNDQVHQAVLLIEQSLVQLNAQPIFLTGEDQNKAVALLHTILSQLPRFLNEESRISLLDKCLKQVDKLIKIDNLEMLRQALNLLRLIDDLIDYSPMNKPERSGRIEFMLQLHLSLAICHIRVIDLGQDEETIENLRDGLKKDALGCFEYFQAFNPYLTNEEKLVLYLANIELLVALGDKEMIAQVQAEIQELNLLNTDLSRYKYVEKTATDPLSHDYLMQKALSLDEFIRQADALSISPVQATSEQFKLLLDCAAAICEDFVAEASVSSPQMRM